MRTSIMRPAREAGGERRRTVPTFLLAAVLALSLVPAVPDAAFAYFDRGSVGIELGTSQLQIFSGETADVSVTLTPSSDQQTEGCGMPKCPQSCAASCMDELGQCRCAGSELSTYYPTAVVTSSNSGVAMAVYRGGRLSVFGRSQGTATITLRASLRQFNDSEATLDVVVSGAAVASDSAAVPSEFLQLPEEAQILSDDRQDLVEKTAMSRPIRFVRIGGAVDPATVLESLAGVDGEATFWEGDTLHQPAYSVTVQGADCTVEDAQKLAGYGSDAFALDVSTAPEGPLTQALAGLDGFVSVAFAQGAPLPCASTVYANAGGAIAEGEPVGLYSYDEAAKAFVAEDAGAEVAGSYVKFTVDEPKTYVVSTHDLTREANVIVDAGEPASTGEDASMGATVPWAVPVAIAAVAAVAVLAFVIVRSRRKAGNAHEA